MSHRLVVVGLLFASTALAQGGITSLSPSSVQVGGPSFTLQVNGGGFMVGNIVQWDGVNQTTTLVSSSQLTINVPASAVASAGSHAVRVKQSAFVNNFSNTVSFTVTNPAPQLSSIAPAVAAVGGSAFVLTATGASFVANSTIRWNGTAIPTTFSSASTLTTLVPPSLLVAPANVNVTVHTPGPGGGTSAAQAFTVSNPAPTLSSVAPATFLVTANPITLTATGTGFNATTALRFDGVALPTTLVSATQVTATLSGAQASQLGSHAVTAFNPSPGGGQTVAFTIDVDNPVPSMGALVPSVVTVGGPAFTLSVSGSNFVNGSTVFFDGAPLTTTFVDPSHLVAFVPASLIATLAFHNIAVTTPAPGGGTSLTGTLFMVHPLPVVASITPASVSGGGPDEVVTITGGGFVGATTVNASGAPLQVLSQSPGQIHVLLPAAVASATAALAITVVNAAPGGGTSQAPLLVTGPVVASVSPTVLGVMSAASPPATLTVTGGVFTAADVVRIDGLPRPTALVDAATLTCTIDTGVPAVLHVGGFGVTVTRPGSAGLVVSNAVGVTVGSAGFPDNAGCVTLGPVPPDLGDEVVIRVEAPVASQPVSVFLDVASPPAFVFAAAPGFDLVAGPGLGFPLTVVDGVGIFGPPTPGAALVIESLAPLGVPVLRGVFASPAFTRPAAPLGVTVSMIAIYGDPASPIGVNATHVSGPYTF